MNVSLTPELEKYVRRKVASGLYNNASELVREALRLLLEREGARSTRPPREPRGGKRTREPPSKKQVLAKLGALKRPLRERGLTSLALFGSVVRGSARSDSDIDILVDVSSEAPFSLVDLISMKDFLERRLGHKVDLVTKIGLDPAIRDRVLSEAEDVF